MHPRDKNGSIEWKVRRRTGKILTWHDEAVRIMKLRGVPSHMIEREIQRGQEEQPLRDKDMTKWFAERKAMEAARGKK